MRTWNLSTLDELETKVVMKFQETPKQRQRGRHSSKPNFGLSLAVVLATAVSGFVPLQCPRVSAESVSLEAVATSVAQSIPRISPPFAELFENRFADGWSPEQEKLGLRAMARSFSP